MQSLMFVLTGFKKDKSPVDLQNLMDKLNQSFIDQSLPIKFDRKDELLLARHNDVSFYVSLFDNERDVKEEFQMAKDFELSAKPNPVDEQAFNKRCHKKRSNSPGLYKDIHYSIANSIFNEMNSISNLAIYFFL